MKDKLILALLKLLSICFGIVIPFILGFIFFMNIVFHFVMDLKVYALELGIPFIVSLLIGYFISEIIDGYEKQIFLEYCKDRNLDTTISNFNYWKNIIR